MRLMADIQDSIKGGTFPDFVRDFMYKFYKQMLKDGRKFGLNKDDADGDPGKVLNENGYPVWVANALASVGIELMLQES